MSRDYHYGLKGMILLIRKMSKPVVVLLAVLIAAYAVIQYGFFRPQDAGLVSLKLSTPGFQLEPWKYALYSHIGTAVVAMLIGPVQLFWKPVGMRRLRLHRLLGYTYVLTITLSGLVSLYLAMHTLGGWKAGLGFLVLDLLWMVTTWISVRSILVNNVRAHKEWMLRSYALTFAAVTLRLWLPVLVLFFRGDFVSAYQLVAWVCWVPNLLLMEMVIRVRKKAAVKTIM
ncbi:MAG: DUF2306 domain-containing protein [Clostridia bacterium]